MRRSGKLGSLALLGLAGAAAGALALAAFAADSTDPRVAITKPDQAAAVGSLVVGSDLGGAWSVQQEKALSLKLPVCSANTPDNHDLTITGHAEAVAALASAGLQIDTDVTVWKSAAQVDRLFARILQPAIRTCLKIDLLKSVGTANVKLGVVSRLPVAKLGSHAALFRVALAVRSGGSTVGVDADYLYLSRGRTAWFVSVVFPQPDEAQIAAIEARLARTLVKRGRV